MESSLGILTKGYDYFNEKFKHQATDVIQTRLFLKKAIVMRGEAAAKIFYDTARFRRPGATPGRFQKTLFGKGGVQGLDGKHHEHRKKMFMQYMNETELGRMRRIFVKYWQRAARRWEVEGSIVLFDESEKVLAQAASEWVGINLPENDVSRRAKQMSAMIDSAGRIGWRHFKGRINRKIAEGWIMRQVEESRSRNGEAGANSILDRFSAFRNLQGELLPAHVVAVEILNLLRPVVAIARYIAFLALALHRNPEYQIKLRNSSDEQLLSFVQEVRRFYPFFPFVAAIVRRQFTWDNIEFPEGRRVLLDLYATNHDDRIYENPEVFDPERFMNQQVSDYNFVPQGGGDYIRNHRCAGELMTVELLKETLYQLVNHVNYVVPAQDLTIDKSRFPTLPASGLILGKVSVRAK